MQRGRLDGLTLPARRAGSNYWPWSNSIGERMTTHRLSPAVRPGFALQLSSRSLC